MKEYLEPILEMIFCGEEDIVRTSSSFDNEGDAQKDWIGNE